MSYNPGAVKLLRLVVRLINVLAALLVVAIGVGAWLLGSERGSAVVVGMAAERSGGALAVEGVAGTLVGGLSIASLRLDVEGHSVQADELAVTFDPLSLLTAALVVERVAARRAEYRVETEAAAGGRGAPELPVAVLVRQGYVQRFALVAGGRTRIFTDARFSLRVIDGRLEVERLDARTAGADIAAGRF